MSTAAADEGPSCSLGGEQFIIFILSGRQNTSRRRSLRGSWFKYLSRQDSPVPPALRASTKVLFVTAKAPQTASIGSTEGQQGQQDALAAEMADHGDIVEVDAPEGYEHLWRKALVFLQWLENSSGLKYAHVMHADDDSFLRLDLLLPLVAGWPRERFYWGYIWDGTGNRVTAPIRNRANKSHMPESQYALDFYPPFASGCGFVLSRDLVLALLKQPLPDYRLLDPPFGIHLCGGPGFCVADEGGPVSPVHCEEVRPYRPLPTFRSDTLVQHYLRPEEMKPFYEQALQAARQSQGPGPSDGQAAPQAQEGGAPQELYNTLVSLGILRR